MEASPLNAAEFSAILDHLAMSDDLAAMALGTKPFVIRAMRRGAVAIPFETSALVIAMDASARTTQLVLAHALAVQDGRDGFARFLANALPRTAASASPSHLRLIEDNDGDCD